VATLAAHEKVTLVSNFLFTAFFFLYTGMAVLWLLAGVAPAVAHALPSLHDQLHEWARSGGPLAGLAGRIADASHRALQGSFVTGVPVVPGNIVVLEYLFSAANLVLAVFLVWLRPRDRAARLLAVGMVGTAAVFNLQAHSALDVVRSGALEFFHDSMFHIVSGMAYVYAIVLFPDGRLPRWRAPAWLKWPVFAAFLFLVGNVGLIGSDFHGSDAAGYLGFFGLVVPISGLVAQAFRYRQASGPEERQQSRLLMVVLGVAFGAALVFFAVTAALKASGQVSQQDIEELSFRIIPPLITLVPLALFAVILRFRLWDVDRVIHKALLYAALAAFLTFVYVAIAVGIGAAVGSGGEPNLFLSILATAVIAVAFQPVRARLQRVANRLVYGQRATPYEVMAGFSERMAGSLSVEEVLPRMAEAAARGVGAARSRVRLFLPGGEVRSMSWPTGGDETSFDRTLAVTHQGEDVGEISVAKPPGEGLTPAEERLLDDLASQAGLALRNVRLTMELQARLEEISAQAEELRASRQRIVAAQDAAARRLERNIHDGAQQQLVSLAVRLSLAESLLDQDPARTRELLAELKAQATDALETLRDLARGIYPPLLADQGLGPALVAQARKTGLSVVINPIRVGRYRQEVEAAVYFCCLEALSNVAKYAGASRVMVRLEDTGGELSFSVEDDGRGFDPASTPRGLGLQNMSDRLAALGGTVEVRSSPEAGTTVSGRVPARALEPIS
jgi:signal transduction histidine kinase